MPRERPSSLGRVGVRLSVDLATGLDLAPPPTGFHFAVLDELFEIQTFLKMRLYELSANDKVHVISMSLLDGFTDHDAKTVTTMLSTVDVVITSLTTSLIQQLYQIKHSPKYVDILANKLRHKLRAVEKLQSMQKLLKEKSIELKQQALNLRPTLEKLIDQTKILQTHVSSNKIFYN